MLGKLHGLGLLHYGSKQKFKGKKIGKRTKISPECEQSTSKKKKRKHARKWRNMFTPHNCSGEFYFITDNQKFAILEYRLVPHLQNDNWASTLGVLYLNIPRPL